MVEKKIKDSYKETEVGVIPDDWQVLSLKDACYQITDGTHFTPNYVNMGVPFYSVENVTENNFTNTKYITEEEHEQLIRRCKPEKGDVLLTRIGTLGKTKLIDWDVNASIYVSLALLKLNNHIDSMFFYSYTKSDFFIRSIEGRSLINAIPQKINMESIGGVPLPLPPIFEQKAIAEALNDVDKLLQSLENLIDKKKKIKQGTMQQLLTGKKRLSGFSGEWELKKFKDVTNLITCGIAATPNYVDSTVGVPFLSSTNVKNGKVIWKDYKYISKELHKKLYKNNPPEKNDILYSRVGSIGEAAIIENDSEFSIYVSLTLIKLKDFIFNGFIVQLLNSDKYKSLANRTVLLGGGVGNLNVNVVREFEIPVPSLEEQIVISKILLDIDSEIEGLEYKLEKYKKIKQGMMQELLTGRIRLI